MNFNRYKEMFLKLRFTMLRDGYARADFLRKNNLLKSIGDNVYFFSRIMPPDSKLLKIGNNVSIATNVRILGHDRIDIILSGMFNRKYTKYYDCVEIGSNVFIGSDVVILPGVKIGDNTIIGAGAVVSKDLPPNCVWGGIPVRMIGEFDTFISKRKDNTTPKNNPDILWDIFYEKRK